MIPADPLAARVPPLTRDPQFLKYWLSETMSSPFREMESLSTSEGQTCRRSM
jgi:hypothetical protein